MLDRDNNEIRLIGIGASPGICIGKAYLVDKEGVDVVEQYYIDPKQLKPEIKRFKTAVKKARDELHQIIEDTPKDLRQHTYILEVHKSLLKDKMLYGKTIETIESEHINAEWALKKTVSQIRTIFQNMSSPYLQERAADVVQLSERIMMNLVGVETVNIGEIDKKVILVAPDLSPAETSQINLERIKGIITARGGKTSHTGIIARSLEIPAVLGIGDTQNILASDDIIVVDGSSGRVIVHPTEQTLVEFEERQQRFAEYQSTITLDSRHPAVTKDGRQINVMGNIEQPEEATAVVRYGGDGIGLYRTEFQYLNREVFPTETELFNKYKDVVEAIAPKPVMIRTLDIDGDKTPSGSEYNGLNPAMGLRGIRYCLHDPDVFLTQLRAILRAAVFGNVRVMFPMVSTPQEVTQAKELFRKAAESLRSEGIPFSDDIEIGILIEVPSAVIMADVIADEVDFFSIGTNDLIQYSLAIDRGNRQVAHLFHPFQPAIIRLLKRTMTSAQEKGIKVFMCGEMASDPINLPIVLGLGLDELSMNPQSIPIVKRSIRSLNAHEAGLFIEEVLKQTTVSDILNLVLETYGDLQTENLE